MAKGLVARPESGGASRGRQRFRGRLPAALAVGTEDVAIVIGNDMVVDVNRAALGSLDAADVSCLARVRVVGGSTGDGGGFTCVCVADRCLAAGSCRAGRRVVSCSALAVGVVAGIHIFHPTTLPNGERAG